MAAKLTAPVTPLLWDHTPEKIAAITQDAILKSRAIQDRVAKLSPEECTFESVFSAMARDESALDATTEPLAFYQNVSPDKVLRDASNESEKALRNYSIEASMRVDVFEAQQNAVKNIKSSGKKLNHEEQRLVDKMMLDGRRAGLALPEKDRDELTKLKKELSAICLEFSKNFNEENGTVAFTQEELYGVPEDVISGYTKRDGAGKDGKDLYDVTFKTPDIFPLFKFAQNPDTRQKALVAFESRLEINAPILKKALDLRREIAKLLRYETWADYIEEVKMIETGKAAKEFLADLEQKLRPVGIKDRDALLALKKEELAKNNCSRPADEFYVWDYRYYDNLFVEKTLDLDDMLVKEYFPVSVVVPTILEIYQELLGVEFVEIKDGVKLWHPDVQFFSLWEKNAQGDKDFLGYTYLDLFPREGKYSHAAVWPIISGCLEEDGSRRYPITAMVANLAKPTPTKPALMRHDDVVTFFHEMGHVFHGLLSRTQFSRFHGTSVARDFVEAPSQMLENWCWEPAVLKRMSSHYKTKEPLSDELIEKLIKSRFVNIGLFNLRQIFFGKFDITVHTETSDKEINYSKLWCDLRESVSLVKTGDTITPGQGTFGHITGGYDAGYYGYLYSLVFSMDMYETVFAKDPMSAESGTKYRNEILLPGGSRDEIDSLKAFLGREPNSEAFLKKILGTSPAKPSL